MPQDTALTRRRTAVATAAVTGLELAWLYALLHALSQGLEFAISVPVLLLAYAASFAVAIGLRAVGRSARLTKVLTWMVWPLATLVLLMVLLYSGPGPVDGSWTAVMLHALRGIPDKVGPAMFIVAACGVLWPLGLRLAISRMTYETVVTEFQLGLMALAGSVLIGYLAGVEQPAAIPTAVIFVGLGLVGAAATRVDDEGGPLFFQRGGTWWGMLFISVSLVLLLGFVAGILFTPELMQYVAKGIRALWGLIMRLMDAIAGLFPTSEGPTELPPGPEVLPVEQGESFSWGLPDWLSSPLRIVYGVLVGGLGLFAAWRIASQFFDWMRRRAGGQGVKMESLPGAFRLDVAKLLRRILAWVTGLLALVRTRRGPREEPSQTTSVRRLYADMLRWGAKSGFPRGSSQTPFEYQQTLCAALPDYRTDVTFITESYVKVKYGAKSPTEAELHQLRESRRRLKRREGHGNARR